MKRTYFRCCGDQLVNRGSLAAVLIAALAMVLLAAGCSSDRYSTEPRTVIAIDRSKTDTASTVTHKKGVNNEPADLGVAPAVNPITGTAAVPETNSATGVNAPPSQLAPGTVGVGLPLNSIATPQNPGVAGAASSPSLPNIGDSVSARPGSATSVGATSGGTTASGLTVTPAPVTSAPGVQNFGTGARPSSTGSATATSAVNAAPTAITGSTSPGLNNNVGGSLGSGLTGTGTGSGISNSLTNNVFTATNLFGPRP